MQGQQQTYLCSVQSDLFDHCDVIDGGGFLVGKAYAALQFIAAVREQAMQWRDHDNANNTNLLHVRRFSVSLIIRQALLVFTNYYAIPRYMFIISRMT